MENKTGDDKRINWKTISTTPIYDAKIMTVQKKVCLSPKNVEREFVTLSSRDWVMVIPEVDIDGIINFIMVKQWRYGSEALSVEFPGGVIDPGETPKEAAVRELAEETGYTADSMQLLTCFSPNPAIMQNKQYVFVARCNKQTPKPLDLDEDEFLSVFLEPHNEIIQKFGTPPYNHSLHCAGLFYYLKYKGLIK